MFKSENSIKSNVNIPRRQLIWTEQDFKQTYYTSQFVKLNRHLV